MFKHTILLAAAAIAAFAVPNEAASRAGSWQVDARHSDAQLITDATTDYGKAKIDVTLGFARVTGRVELDNDDPARSSFDFRIYPATSMSPAIDEDGNFLSRSLANLPIDTLVSFHSKGAVRTADGRLQTTGNLIVTRVERSVEATPNEAYAGPYGPPLIHRASLEVTFVFDLPAADGKQQKDGAILASGRTRMFSEDYPESVRAVVGTYWPLVAQDENCHAPANVGEDYHGAECTGTLLEVPALPEVPHAANGEDVGVSQDFNVVVGNQLNILVHLRLMPQGVRGTAVAGN